MRNFTFIVIAALSLLCTNVSAAIILNIDVSDPTAVAISTSGANSDADDSETVTFNGIALRQFLIANQTSFSSFGAIGTLTGGASGQAYNFFTIQPATGGLGARDANIFKLGGLASQDFNTTSPAFTGSTTWDLSSIAGLLPSAGATGDIFAGDQLRVDPAVIGQWAVIGQTGAVPEPTSLIVWALLGTVGLTVGRRHRRRTA